MLWRLDNKEAVDISSIPDKDLMKLLQLAFDNLKLLKVKEVKADLSSAPHERLNGLLLREESFQLCI